MADLTGMHRTALWFVWASGADLREVSEPMRHTLIDLGMMDPPMVDVDGDQVSLTEAGRRALANPATGEG